MSDVVKNIEDLKDEAGPELRDLLLSRSVWTQAIERLEREKRRLAEAADVAQPEQSNGIRLRLAQIEHETAMYEICIDRVQERMEHCQGLANEETMRQRERFYRLMRGVAKAGNERADASHRDPYIGCVAGEEGWSPDRWVSEMESVASGARKQLVSATAS